jgi:hypothetical protein
MSRIFVHGVGAVSPAGWGAGALVEAVKRGEPLPLQPLVRPGQEYPLAVRRVPAPQPRPAFLAHPRLRRTSPISHFAVGAALEALGADQAAVAAGQLRLGIIFCAFTGCVGYSRRFYDEVLRDPATASPLIFPETVFNAPASHLAAFFGTTAVNYTVVGDQGEFVKSLALAAEWLNAGSVDGCLVVGAEEADWLSAEALEMLEPNLPAAEGAGAVYLRREPAAVELVAVTEPQLYLGPDGRASACERTWQQLAEYAGPAVLRVFNAQITARFLTLVASPISVLGEGFGAGGAWNVVYAAARLAADKRGDAIVDIHGINEQSVAAVFRRT